MKNIKEFTLDELKCLFSKLDEPAYRAQQVFSWIYQKYALNFEEMTDISQSLRDKLSHEFYIGTISLSQHLTSKDYTEKFLFKLEDNNYIESVLIYAENRTTLCISTQIGCKYSCLFCASGHIRFKRNLTVSEIISQILFIKRKGKHKINNYVFMGMGEPLDNLENVLKSIKIMNAPKGLNIGANKITISTCGIIKGITKITNFEPRINLSVSLHATNNKLRDILVPVNKLYPIEKLVKACEIYTNKTKKVITLEYILIKGKNDSYKDADELSKIAKRLNAKVNIIPCSNSSHTHTSPPDNAETVFFIETIKKKWKKVTLRKSKGNDIQAACGQLALGSINEI